MRLAVIGLGYMGGVHVKALRQRRNITLEAVVSQRGGLDGVRCYREIAAALADPKIDAVDLCLPTDLHESVAIEALGAGKHVLVEKPMALDPAACDRMIEAARRHGRILMVAHVLRFHPAYCAIRDALTRVGKIRTAIFRRRCGVPDWGDWLPDPKRSGGAVLDLLVHDADMALHWFGPPAAVAATGPENMDVVSAHLFYDSGLTIEISGGWFPGKLPFTMECTVAGDAGTVDYRLGEPPRICSPGAVEELPVDEADAFARQLEYFSDCVQSGEQPEQCRPEESAAAVRLARVIQEARKRNGEKVPWKSG